MHRHILPLSSIAIAVGVLTATYTSLAYIGIPLILGVISIIIFSSVIFSWKSKVILFLILALIFSLGYMRATSTFKQGPDPFLEIRAGNHITLEGEILTHPEKRIDHQRIIVGISEFEGMYFERAQRILVQVPLYENVARGQRIWLDGQLRRAESFITDTGRVFHYDKFLAKDDMYFTMSFASIDIIEEQKNLRLTDHLYKFKNHNISRLQRLFPEPHASLIAGMLLGERGSVDPAIQDNFRTTGVVHILVLSGFHITLVSLCIFGVLRYFLPEKWSLILSIMAIILFVMMVGASATIIRASSMAITAILARIFGRSHSGLRGLLLVGGGMILHNPYILLWDVSFQLSFLATLGLILFSSFFEKLCAYVPRFFGIQETLIATLSAQLMVMPLLLYAMGNFSTIAPLANILVVPWTVFILGGSAVALILSSIFMPLGYLFMLPVYGLVSFQIYITEKLAQWSFASVQIPLLPLWSIIGMYVILISGGVVVHRSGG